MGYSIDEAKDLVIRAGKELVTKGLIARTWGNISARVSENEFVITPSGRSYDDLTPDDIVLVDLDGNYEGSIKPSSEKKVHAEAYRYRPEVNFVIHTHQVNASAISILGKSIPLGESICQGIKDIVGPKIICANYGLSSTDKLQRAVGAALVANPECNHVLMKYHGALCVGADYDSAFKVADTLEEICGRIFEKYVDAPIATAPNAIEFIEAPAYESFEDSGASDDEPEMVVIHAHTPYTTKISKLGQAMRAYIDDLAQIAGANIKCAPAGASYDEIAMIKGSNSAVLIDGDGAYCYGTSEDEAMAVVQVLEKGCMAAYLAYKKDAAPVALINALIERRIYVKKYSALKDVNK